MAQRRSAKFKKYMKCQRYIAHSGTFDTKSKVFNAISQWQRRSAKIKKHTKRQRYSAHSGAFDPKNRMVDTTSLVVWLQHQQKQHNQQHQQSKQHQQPMHQLNQHQQSKQHQQHMHQLNQNEQSKQHHQHMHQHRQSQQHMHQHKQPAPATISTSNTSSRAGQQRQQHQRSSVKQQQDQNGNTENTNMISKMQQKPSARPKKYQHLVYCRLGESGFCYSPQRARALASTFQGTLRLNQRTSRYLIAEWWASSMEKHFFCFQAKKTSARRKGDFSHWAFQKPRKKHVKEETSEGLAL